MAFSQRTENSKKILENFRNCQQLKNGFKSYESADKKTLRFFIKIPIYKKEEIKSTLRIIFNDVYNYTLSTKYKVLYHEF